MTRARDRSGAEEASGEAGRTRIGVDTGGTFTDLVWLEDGEERARAKLPSTPDEPARAVLEGLGRLIERAGASGASGASGGPARADEVVHGTTVALNALLTGRIARAALVTNAGFRDLIEIGRQERPDIYALHPEKPAALVPRERRFEIEQRTWPDLEGRMVEARAPSPVELARLVRAVRRSGAESLAVCLLHSFADPAIEERVARALEPLGLPITCSAGILPAYREFERFSTAVANAALVPVVGAYLARLGERLGERVPGARFSVLQSSGGTLGAARAASEPVRVLLSGPAGGVVGAARAGSEAGLGEIVTLDMGGTSTDVAFHAPGSGAIQATGELRVGGHPIGVPSLDIHTIGCGGGSLVFVDAGGVLHVGPESAGADPGPVCYGRGAELTVTDAHVALGHLAAGSFLDGELELDQGAVQRAFERLARRLGVRPVEAARGVLEVARAGIRRAVGVMTMQRGRDPKRLSLVAFGGAGGLSAAAVARSLEMPGALVPARPGLLSAIGMAKADAVRDHARSVLAPLAAWPGRARKAALSELARAGAAELREAGFPARQVETESALDLRYRGQSHELVLAEGADLEAAFHALHEERYGWRLDAGEIELVNLRVRSLVRARDTAARGPSPRRRAAPKDARVGERRVTFERAVVTDIVDRARLAEGHVVRGPAVIEEFSGTTLVPPGWRAEVRSGGHLWLRYDSSS